MAVREYQEKRLPADIARRVVEAAHLTASSSNVQAWHFVLVRERDALRKIGPLMRSAPYIANATAAVVVAYEKKTASGVSDCSRAIQSMILTAWGDGVASNMSGFGGLEGVRKECRIPDTYEVFAVVPLGYPARPVLGKKKRKPFNEVVSAERFGTPLA